MEHDPVTVVVRGLLEGSKMTDRELSRRSGIASTTLNRRLNQGGWKVHELDRIAQVFGTTASNVKALAEGVAA